MKPENGKLIRGRVYVLGDNIDTDRIIPAVYLNLVPTIPEEYDQLGSHALEGLSQDYPPFMKKGELKSDYSIILAGRNFGCGSSREHAPVALAAAGVRAVIAESYARIFFRNVVATGKLFPLETEENICDAVRTGEAAEIDLRAPTLSVGQGRVFRLKPPGAMIEVIEAGGIFGYARAAGMIGNPPGR